MRSNSPDPTHPIPGKGEGGNGKGYGAAPRGKGEKGKGKGLRPGERGNGKGKSTTGRLSYYPTTHGIQVKEIDAPGCWSKSAALRRVCAIAATAPLLSKAG